MFIILETQYNSSTGVSSLIYQEEDRLEADSVFYMKLSAAAISKVEIHSVFLLDDEGHMYDSKCYKHPTLTND